MGPCWLLATPALDASTACCGRNISDTAGAICLKISCGPVTGLVEAAALDNNALPLILGEDWISSSQAQLIFPPPKPTEIRHSLTGTTVQCAVCMNNCCLVCRMQ